MTSSPKRPWFRFHLLTAVLMMVAAGYLLRQNCMRVETETGSDMAAADAMVRMTAYVTDPYYVYGWPSTIYSTGKFDLYVPHWHFKGVIINASTAISVLVAVACVSEWLIRRREARKT